MMSYVKLGAVGQRAFSVNSFALLAIIFLIEFMASRE